MNVLRHPPARIHVEKKLLHDRFGRTVPALDLAIAGSALYFRTEPWRHAGPIAEAQIQHHERWALPDLQLFVHRFTLFEGAMPFDWYVDLDRITVSGGIWTIEDQLLDVEIFECQQYLVRDADELAEMLENGAASPAEAAGALRSLHTVTTILAANGMSGSALLAEYAAGLPAPLST